MIAILQNARAMRLHLETTQGYNPLQPMVYMEFIEAMNRALDLVIAGLLLVLSAPLMGAAAVAIKIESRGPVFYRQQRVGLSALALLLPQPG